MTELTTMGLAECRQLLRAGTFGRLAVTTPEGPEIVPVNYRVIADEVVVRSASGTVLARHADQAAVCFEIDLVDYARWVGWSVVAKGVARVERVRSSELLASGPRPWAMTEGDAIIRLPWRSISGRQIGVGWSALLAMPARTTSV